MTAMYALVELAFDGPVEPIPADRTPLVAIFRASDEREHRVRRLDAALAALGDRGIQADVLIFNAYDRGHFGFDRFTEEEDAAYLRYLVARLSAFPNVWWSLCNEFEQLERPAERWHRVGALLAEIDPHAHTGRSVLEFAREYLFEPLDIPTEPATDIVMSGDDVVALITAFNAADFAWPVDPQGFHDGSSLLKLRPQDLAALGLAYLAEGRSPRGDQVIPDAWVATATATQVGNADSGLGYGYLWWTLEADGARGFAALGLGGQLIEVVPDRDLVVVVATEYDERDLKSISPRTLTAMVSAWIAPHFATD